MARAGAVRRRDIEPGRSETNGQDESSLEAPRAEAGSFGVGEPLEVLDA